VCAPLLVCHGTADPAVPISEGRALADAAQNARFEAFDGADHVLDCRHPWQGATPHFQRFVQLAAEHFSKNL
jgi:pimeloyl-ACP methyl ester carboxylesterase